MKVRCLEEQNIDDNGNEAKSPIQKGRVYTVRDTHTENGDKFYSFEELDENDYFDSNMFIVETVAGKYGIVNENEPNVAIGG